MAPSGFGVQFSVEASNESSAEGEAALLPSKSAPSKTGQRQRISLESISNITPKLPFAKSHTSMGFGEDGDMDEEGLRKTGPSPVAAATAGGMMDVASPLSKPKEAPTLPEPGEENFDLGSTMSTGSTGLTSSMAKFKKAATKAKVMVGLKSLQEDREDEESDRVRLLREVVKSTATVKALRRFNADSFVKKRSIMMQIGPGEEEEGEDAGDSSPGSPGARRESQQAAEPKPLTNSEKLVEKYIRRHTRDLQYHGTIDEVCAQLTDGVAVARYLERSRDMIKGMRDRIAKGEVDETQHLEARQWKRSEEILVVEGGECTEESTREARAKEERGQENFIHENVHFDELKELTRLVAEAESYEALRTNFPVQDHAYHSCLPLLTDHCLDNDEIRAVLGLDQEEAEFSKRHREKTRSQSDDIEDLREQMRSPRDREQQQKQMQQSPGGGVGGAGAPQHHGSGSPHAGSPRFFRSPTSSASAFAGREPQLPHLQPRDRGVSSASLESVTSGSGGSLPMMDHEETAPSKSPSNRPRGSEEIPGLLTLPVPAFMAALMAGTEEDEDENDEDEEEDGQEEDSGTTPANRGSKTLKRSSTGLSLAGAESESLVGGALAAAAEDKFGKSPTSASQRNLVDEE